jgi:hypothetical protein
MKPPWKRTPIDIKFFAGIIDKLKLFASYPQRVRQGLAKIAYYEAFGEGRVIVRQGKNVNLFTQELITVKLVP